MDPQALIQLLLRMQNDSSVPNKGFSPDQAKQKQHTGWEPDPDRAETSAAGASENEEPTSSATSEGLDLAKLLPLFLQMMNGQKTDETAQADSDNGSELAKLLPIFLQMMNGQKADRTAQADSDNGSELAKLLPIFLQMMNKRERAKEARSDSDWVESEFTPNDIRQEDTATEQTRESSAETRPSFGDEHFTRTAFAEFEFPSGAYQTRTEKPPTESDRVSTTAEPKGLLPVAFAPPPLIYRLNLYFSRETS